jgi:hypothetical protein
MPQQKRKHLHVGERVQTVLAVRAATHWLLCLTVVFVSIFLAHLFTNPELGLAGNWQGTWVLMGPPLVMSVCFLPWVVIDNLKLSNRFSGPIVKIRTELGRLRDGEELRPITLRKHDFFGEVADEINAIAASNSSDADANQHQELCETK